MVKTLKVIIALEDALFRFVSKSIALVKLLPEWIASVASWKIESYRLLLKCDNSDKKIVSFKVDVLMDQQRRL